MAECMKRGGYKTALIGKWHIEVDPALLGFDYALYPNVIHRHYKQEYVENDGEPFVVDEFAPDFELAKLQSFLSDNKAHPFFLYYNISQPHQPIGTEHCPDRFHNIYSKETVPIRANVPKEDKIQRIEEWFKVYTKDDFWWGCPRFC